MKLTNLTTSLGIGNPNNLTGMSLYRHIRQSYFQHFISLLRNSFQSPSVNPTSHRQRTKVQIESEHSVYQRSDYTPLGLENSFNSVFPSIGLIAPKTLFFNNGMAAISCLAYYLHGPKNIQKLVLGENTYFETKWLLSDYHRCRLVNEYLLDIPSGADVYWFEYPINCASPSKYPFLEQLNLDRFFQEIFKIVSIASSHVYLVLDYTLYYLPFNLTPYLKSLPPNLTVFLVTSLQKHRGLGLDLTNAGAVTVYSHQITDIYDYLGRVRAISGTSITQETAWLMPPLNPRIINQIITDSGLEARRIYHLVNHPNSLIKLYCAENNDFQTSFIYIGIDSELMKFSTSTPYFSDLLIAEIIAVAKRQHAVLVQGTSFGFPFCRIFKNSERYDNTSTIRLAVGYDPDLNRNVDLALSEGINSFIQKHKL